MQEIEFHRALHRPGTIVDVGAHDGRLTLPLAKLPNSDVVAFEPLPPAFARLRQSVSAAWGGEIPRHITLRREALADRSGMATISAPRINGVLQEEWASISKDYAALRTADPRIEAVETWSVPSLRLDDVGLTGVTAIKIDVEGAELEVLRGSWMTLQRWRPCLSIEIEERHRPGSTRAVPELMRDLDYEGWFEFFGEWGTSSTWMSRRCSEPLPHRQSSPCRTHTCSASISCRGSVEGIWPAWRGSPDATVSAAAMPPPAGQLSLAAPPIRPHAPPMFVVTEADAARIRAAFERGGEFSAAVELRRLFPGISDNAEARRCARTIAGWKPLAMPLRPVRLRQPVKGC